MRRKLFQTNPRIPWVDKPRTNAKRKIVGQDLSSLSHSAVLKVGIINERPHANKTIKRLPISIREDIKQKTHREALITI